MHARISKAVTCLVCAALLPSITLGIPPKYEATDAGLKLEGVSPDCPMIYDNDWWTDVPDAAYLWAKASLGKCKLKGNVITRCTFGWEEGYAHKLKEQVDDAQRLYRLARASGLRNVPEPILGAKEVLRRPANGKIEDTRFECSPGSDLIVTEARKANPRKPLLVFCGGSCTTVAAAYLTDPKIVERIIVFQVDGGIYNGSDAWAWKIVMERCRFANWAQEYFWDKITTKQPHRFHDLPKNPLCEFLKDWAFKGHGKGGGWGDAPWIFYTFDHRCLTKAKVYDKLAVTVPNEGTNLKQMEEEFFSTMSNAAIYRSERQPDK